MVDGDWGDRKFVIQKVQEDWAWLRCASEKLRADASFIRDVLLKHIDVAALQYATEELKGNCDFMTDLVVKLPSPSVLEYATEALRGDRAFIMKVVEKHWLALRYASEELRDSREIVMQAVSQDGGAFKYASERIQRNRDIVIEAVRLDGFAYEFASEDLRSDQTIMDLALKQVSSSTRLQATILKVGLLSGKRCHQIFCIDSDCLDDVKQQCAGLLDLDPLYVIDHGTLLLGTTTIRSLSDFDAGQVHELTLILS